MQGFIGFLCIVFGIVGAASPQTAWYLSLGWKLKDAEPSDAALVMHRVGGALSVILGLVIMVSSCAGGSSGSGVDLQNKLKAQEVRAITVGWGADAHDLTKEEKERAVDLMAHAKMTGYDLGASYGSSGAAKIVFADGTTSDLLLFGPNGGVSWLVYDKAYKFESGELESLFRSRLNQ